MWTFLCLLTSGGQSWVEDKANDYKIKQKAINDPRKHEAK
jgi:hypothetical protein